MATNSCDGDAKIGTAKGNVNKRVLLLGCLLYYCVATLPFIGRYKTWDSAEMMIAAPAYQFATTGKYASEMYQGFFNSEQHNYDHMPLYALPLAAGWRLFGANSLLLPRLLSFSYGLIGLALLYRLGSQLYDASIGLIAAAVLAGLKLGAVSGTSGIPQVDIGRITRFDILIPVWTLSACLVFLHARKTERWHTYVAVGVLGGLATLTHVYGAFVLVIAGLLLLWDKKPLPILYISFGWLLALTPYFLYIAQDIRAYQGQMLRHAERLGFLNLAFYQRNITEEQYRFLAWFGGSYESPILWPRIGIWVFFVGILLANIVLLHRMCTSPTFADRFTWLALPAVWLPLILLITLKRYYYVTLLMPFFALQIAVAAVWLWREQQRLRWLWSLIAALLVFESVLGVAQNVRAAAQATPYETVAAEIRAALPTASRVMAMPIFWYALRDRDFLSLDLAFVKSAERFHYTPQPTAYDVIGDYAPDYLLIAQGMLNQDPTTFPRAELAQQWADIKRYLATRCAAPVVVSESADYGILLLAHCNL